jgi:hypothetical protein
MARGTEVRQNPHRTEAGSSEPRPGKGRRELDLCVKEVEDTLPSLDSGIAYAWFGPVTLPAAYFGPQTACPTGHCRALVRSSGSPNKVSQAPSC